MYETMLLLFGMGAGGLVGTIVLWPMYREAIERRDDIERALGRAQRDIGRMSAEYRDEVAAHGTTKTMLDAAQLELETAQDALREAARTVVDMAKPADGDPPAGGAA